jgi:hypothetical protein
MFVKSFLKILKINKTNREKLYPKEHMAEKLNATRSTKKQQVTEERMYCRIEEVSYQANRKSMSITQKMFFY